MTADKFLVVRLAAIGDVVMASTVIGRIREKHPAATIDWLCGETAAPLVEHFEGVNRVIVVDERKLLRGGALARAGVLLPLWTQLIGSGYGHVVLLHVDARYRVLIAPLVGAKVSTLTRRDSHGAMNPIPGRYLGDEYARLLDGPESRGPIVGHAPLATMRTTRHARPASNRIAIVPAGTRNVLRESALKRWPAERYAEVARALAGDGYEVVLIGDASDAWVRPMFEGIRVTDMLGGLTLPETVEAMADCSLVISHDTGPMHLARLARVPLLALFGPTPPSHFIVPDALATVLWGGEHLACRPCYDGREFAACSDNQCVTSIATDVVLRTARTILSRSNLATPDRPPLQIPTESALR